MIKPALILVMEKYMIFWPGIIAALIINTAIIFYLNTILRRRLLCTDIPGAVPASAGTRMIIICFAALFALWKSINLGLDDFDGMEVFNSFMFYSEQPRDWVEILNPVIFVGHQPVFPFLAKTVMLLVDFKFYTFAVRMFSVISIAVSSVFIFLFALRVSGNRLISYAAFFIFNILSLTVSYSRRAEPYALLCLFATLSYYYYWQVFVSGQAEKLWKYCLVNIAGFFTHYILLTAVFSQFLAVLWMKLKGLEPFRGQFLLFLKSIFYFNFVFILFSPAIYVTCLNNPAVFSDQWGSKLYEELYKLPGMAYNVVRIILSLPREAVFSFFCLAALVIALFRLRSANRQFFILFLSAVFSAAIYEIVILSLLYSRNQGFFFNVRHLIWISPLIAVFYAFGIYSFSREKAVLKFFGFCFFAALAAWNVYFSNTVIFKPQNPAYKEAVRFIKNNFKSGDFVGIPVYYLDGPVVMSSRGVFDEVYNYDRNVFGEVRFDNFIEKKRSYKRVWMVIPREMIVDYPHYNFDFIENYLEFLKKNSRLRSVWHGNNIEVYLFEVS